VSAREQRRAQHLVDAARLMGRLGHPGVRVVDCRWRLGQPGAARALYEDGHIPGATFLDVDADLTGAPGPAGRHPLPEPAALAAALTRVGIGPDTSVIAYDDAALGGAARLWWLLRAVGHAAVRVLDGGLSVWLEAGGELERGPASPPAPGVVPFPARPPVPASIATAEDLLGEGSRGRPRLLDARAGDRFRGEHEPIDPVAGHIPGALNLPFTSLLAPDGRFRAEPELRAAFAAAGVDDGRDVVAYCGSGVSACTLLLAAAAVGIEGARLYPGSWSEWSARGLPVQRS
jgi:thiosulfate/3-mercaptopyruvate sulfurtransferase